MGLKCVENPMANAIRWERQVNHAHICDIRVLDEKREPHTHCMHIIATFVTLAIPTKPPNIMDTMANARVLMLLRLLSELFSSSPTTAEGKMKNYFVSCVPYTHCLGIVFQLFISFFFRSSLFFFNKMRNLSCLRWINSTCAPANISSTKKISV